MQPFQRLCFYTPWQSLHTAPSLLTCAGQTIGLQMTLPAILNLTVGTSIGLVVVGGSALELFYITICQKCVDNPMTMMEWCVVFSALCLILAQLPNMNSMAGVSLAGAIMAVLYTTLIWMISVLKKRPHHISYSLATEGESPLVTTFAVLNAIGIITFAFRGHNLVLEIQVCGSLSTWNHQKNL